MELSFMEMVVIGVIAFVVFGPEELIRKAAQFGRFVGKMKTQVNNFKIMAEEELLRKDLLKELDLKGVDLKSLNKTIDIESAIKRTIHPDPVVKESTGTEPSVLALPATTATDLESDIEKNLLMLNKPK